MSNVVDQIRKESLRSDLSPFVVGDMIKVYVKIIEGDAERQQMFQGTVISRRGSGLEETFTVRRVVSGEGVERIFPLNSPRIARIEIIRKGSVRRAKLYYLRNKIGRAARVKEQSAN
ncbi:MAG: 50S ribosomal protein L19 [Victivallaceae bacterium]|nr:50S ribosomal protein L19 [Victivallaceae bacterium]